MAAAFCSTNATGFPRDFLSVLRCSRDAGPLAIIAELEGDERYVFEAWVRCVTCAAEYRIEEGIARLLDGRLTPESEHEIAVRDANDALTQPGPFAAPTFGWRSQLSDLLEIPPHLDALEAGNCTVLELGCGDGRFTLLMAQMGARVLAVDFSINALRVLASRLPSGVAPTTYQVSKRRQVTELNSCVGLVHADASQFHVAPRCFDRALSTTPLDSRDERMAMYRTIAEALKDEGRFVGSVEHDDLTRRLLGLPVARRYDNGIFIEHFNPATMRREAMPYFAKLRTRIIRPRIPFLHRAPSGWALPLSRIFGAMPILRGLGEILLLRAERPLRPPVEGVRRRGNALAQRFYRWYMRKIGKEPLREDYEPV
jgi:SAM-dependent methyltransferase